MTPRLYAAQVNANVFITNSASSLSSVGAGEVSEAALVRDILYVFQGIDGKFIKMSAQDNCYKIDSKVPEPVSIPVKLLID